MIDGRLAPWETLRNTILLPKLPEESGAVSHSEGREAAGFPCFRFRYRVAPRTTAHDVGHTWSLTGLDIV